VNSSITMKVFFILLFSLLTPALSFTSPRPVFVARTHSVALEDTAAEEYLAGCLDKWDEVEKELVNLKAEAKVSSDDIANQIAAAALAEKMLMKALDTARATRDVEIEQACAAHETFDGAMEEELEGKAALQQIDGDVIGAIQEAGMVEGLDAPYEDTERLRDLSVAHAAHDEGMDWMAKVMNAENVAAKARQDFTGAERKVEQLQKNEAELKAALKELHDAKNTLMRKQWEQQKEE